MTSRRLAYSMTPDERAKAEAWEKWNERPWLNRFLAFLGLRKRPAQPPVGPINRDPYPYWRNDPEPRSSTGRTSDFDSDNARSSRAGAATKETPVSDERMTIDEVGEALREAGAHGPSTKTSNLLAYDDALGWVTWRNPGNAAWLPKAAAEAFIARVLPDLKDSAQASKDRPSRAEIMRRHKEDTGG